MRKVAFCSSVSAAGFGPIDDEATHYWLRITRHSLLITHHSSLIGPIDEAYTLTRRGQNSDFGVEAVEEIMKDLTSGGCLAAMRSMPHHACPHPHFTAIPTLVSTLVSTLVPHF